MGQVGHSPITRVDPSRGRPADAVAATLPSNRANFPGGSGTAYSSLPISSHTTRPADDTAYGVPPFGSNGLADEFGSTRPPPPPNAVNVTSLVPPSATSSSSLPITTNNSTAARRPNSSGGGHRFTVTNLQPQDIPQPAPTPSRQRSANGTGSGPNPGNAQRQWPTAEEEKMRLYEQARAQVAKVQGPGSTPVCSQLFFNLLMIFLIMHLHIAACYCH